MATQIVAEPAIAPSSSVEKTQLLPSLSFDQYNALEGHLRAARAVADVLMCGGATNCAPDTVHALGEVIYYRLAEVEAALGLNPEPLLAAGEAE